MAVWRTMFKKDVRLLSTGWLITLATLVVVVAAIATASYFGLVRAGVATTVGVILTVSNLFVFPAHVFKGLNKEMKRTPSLWLQTPLSGWSMLTSKLLASLLGAILFLVVGYVLSLALFHIDLGHALPVLQGQSQKNVHGFDFSWHINGSSTLTPEQLDLANAIIGQIPFIEFYSVLALLSLGLYIAMWVSFVYISVQAVKNRLKKFSWLVGFGIVFFATWGLGALENTTLYEQGFGWGKIPVLSLLPENVQSLILVQSPQALPAITIGYVVFDIIIMAILFYLTGRMMDRHVEV